MRRVLLAVFLMTIALSSTALAGETHPFSIHDMLAMERVSGPEVSPDGRFAAFTLRTTDREANRGRHDIWVARTDGKGVRQLTSHEGTDYGPRWAPDSKWLYFVSTRGGSAQVWKIALDGGEALPVTNLPLDVDNLNISRDGQWLAVSMEVFPDCDTLACTTKRLEERKASKVSGKIYDKLFVRHWDYWKDGRRRHVFVVPSAGGEAIDMMPGMDADSPSIPWGGPEEITFTPDSKSVVFTTRDVGREEAWSTNFDLFTAPIATPDQRTNLTADNPAWDTTPVFSPDGKTMAFFAMEKPGYESDRRRIRLMRWSDKETRTLTEDWDSSPYSIAWAPGGKSIYASTGHLGQHGIFSVDTRSGKVTPVVLEGTNRGAQPFGKGIVFARDSLKSPVELWTCDRRGRGRKQITHFNTARLDAARMGDYEQFTFEGAKGEKVWGYLVKPADFDPAKKYPVAFLIHGGPQGSFGNHFHYRWNPQAYAGAGYAAVMIDFHGSSGYGQAFTDSIRGDWGGAPYEDLMKGLDAALEKYAFLDGERVGALGASYGGYMIYWAAGQTDRFRCLISHDGNIDERFAYFDTEELWFPEWDHEGTPWTNPEGYAKHNPIEHIHKWKTPMLVIHGERDYRVVVTQGIGAFNALQRLGVPSRFLYFPDENHWVLKPANSVLWHETVLDWLGKWTTP